MRVPNVPPILSVVDPRYPSQQFGAMVLAQEANGCLFGALLASKFGSTPLGLRLISV